MPRHPRTTAESGIYHVMLRGVNRDAIFLEDADFERFLHALASAKDASGCSVLAYCLMTNHAHLVLLPTSEPLGTVMKRLGVRYAGWFNRKYGRVGHVFQDRFKSIPVETDEYLVALLRYVWNNPVEAGLAKRPEDYPWSSHRFLGATSELIDQAQLQRLVSDDTLAELASNPVLADTASTPVPDPGQPIRPAAQQIMRERIGIGTPTEFLQLSLTAQQRAIADLRTRSFSYAVIASATGMSTSAVRRLHARRLGTATGQAVRSDQ